MRCLLYFRSQAQTAARGAPSVAVHEFHLQAEGAMLAIAGDRMAVYQTRTRAQRFELMSRLVHASSSWEAVQCTGVLAC